MKQHITLEQIKELSKEKYKILFEKLGKDYYEGTNIEIINGDMLSTAHRLTIGKMIEIVQNNMPNKSMCLWLDNEMGEKTEIYESPYDFNFYTAKYVGNSLCDTLWEAVKVIL